MAARSDQSSVEVTPVRSKANGNVLLLEARKDFIDILLSFLTLPAGAITKLLSEGVKVGAISGISSILQSVENLEQSVLYVDKAKLTDLRPAAATSFTASSLLSIQSELPQPLPNLYQCFHCTSYLSVVSNTVCPKCGYGMTCCTSYVGSSVFTQVQNTLGYVKEDLTYIVTDTLEIMPTSFLKSMDILSKMKVEKVSDLESSTVCIGSAEVLQLLRSSVAPTFGLNDVFGISKKTS